LLIIIIKLSFSYTFLSPRKIFENSPLPSAPSPPPLSSPLKGEEMRKGNPGEPGFEFLK